MNDIPKKPIRVRFAPSPTGKMHVGNFRTALYNYLFAKRNNGVFYIRIEDTDRMRLIQNGSEHILKTLQRMGITHDEGPFLENERIVEKGTCGPYIQSKRLGIYRTHIDMLVQKSAAYPCFCTEGRLEEMRKNQEAEKRPPMYDKTCRSLTQSETKKRIEANEHYVIRFAMPDEGETTFNDIIRGDVSFKNALLDDYVLLKSDGYPTYHLANVVDDHLMGTTDVIRGEEWLSSTPKHVLLYAALGWDTPRWAHLPLLLNSDRSKLSKRQGDVAVEDYLEKGYLPEALINFVALLGWNPGTEKEIFNLTELADSFSLERMQKGGAVFDIEKLNWMNQQYAIHPEKRWLRGTEDVFVKMAEKILHELNPPLFVVGASNTARAVQSIREHLNNPAELKEYAETAFSPLVEYDTELLRWRKMKDIREAQQSLRELEEFFQTIDEGGWENNIEIKLSEYAAKKEDKGTVLWPLRVALSGHERSESPMVLARIFGKKETITRIKNAIDKLSK